MSKKSTTIRVDEETWKQFKKDCIDKGTSASNEIDKLIRRKNNGKQHN